MSWNNQQLAWFDYLSIPITLMWFLALTYLLMTTLVKYLLVPKGEARAPFLLCWEKSKSDAGDDGQLLSQRIAATK